MSARNIQIFYDTLMRLYRRGAVKNIEKMLERSHAADIAQVIRHMDQGVDKRAVFGFIHDIQKKADVLQVLAVQETIAIIEGMDHQKIVTIFQHMPSHTVTDIIGSLPESDSEALLKMMEPKGSEAIEELLRYPQDSAGGIMKTEFCALPRDLTVSETVRKLQTEMELENIFYVYVINKSGQMVGVLSLRTLLQVKPETRIEDIMITDVISVRTDTDQEEVSKLVARYNLLALPVLDESNKLVGIVTVDDVVDVIRDEATEDILKMGGVSESEVLEKSSFKSARMRLPWLFISLLGGVIAFKIMVAFQSVLQMTLILAFFIPLMMGMTGNVAIQAATIVVRGLSTGHIRIRQIGEILWKELKVGCLLGIVYGVIVGAFANVQLGQTSPYLGLVVGGALSAAMMIAALLGASLPFIFERFRIDPAFSTGPFVTTIVDVIGILIYFNLAVLLNGAL